MGLKIDSATSSRSMKTREELSAVHGSAILARPWLTVFLPINAALSGFSVILPVLILFAYGGTVVAVALAITLYNIMVIPGAFFWGRVCDVMSRRRPLLALNYAAVGVIFLLSGLIHSLDALLVLYAIFGWFAPSGAAASNLMIMERFDLHERPTAYTSFTEMGVIGGTLGILAGLFWVTQYPGNLPSFLYLVSLLAFVSLSMLFVLVPERKVRLERSAIAHHHESLDSRLRTLYPFFLGLPTRRFWDRTYHWLRKEATHDVPLILAASFLFNFAANLFNTSYTPFLEVLGLGAAGVFMVNLANNAAQAFSLPFSARTSEGELAERSVVTASWMRASGYAGVFVFAALLPLGLLKSSGHDPLFLPFNVVFYGLLGVAVAFYTTSSSLLLFRSLERRSAGSYLGMNSALGGLAAILGSGLSGVITSDIGFSATFGISVVAMVLAVPVWLLSARAFRARHL